jgi:hypothetical protein
LVDLTCDQHGYFNLFVSYWNQRRSFIVLEQDVLPTEEQFASMPACGEPWCTGTHVLFDGAPEIWSLGLMKFLAALTKRHFEQAVSGSDEPEGAEMLAQVLGVDKSWCRVDLASTPCSV